MDYPSSSDGPITTASYLNLIAVGLPHHSEIWCWYGSFREKITFAMQTRSSRRFHYYGNNLNSRWGLKIGQTLAGVSMDPCPPSNLYSPHVPEGHVPYEFKATRWFRLFFYSSCSLRPRCVFLRMHNDNTENSWNDFDHEQQLLFSSIIELAAKLFVNIDFNVAIQTFFQLTRTTRITANPMGRSCFRNSATPKKQGIVLVLRSHFHAVSYF